MRITARINPEYLVRILLVVLLLIGFGIWTWYDGMTGYPEHNRRVLKYREFQEQDKVDEWEQYAISRDWPIEDPGPPHSPLDIRFQFGLSAVFIPGGAGLLIYLLILRRRRYAADDAGLHGFRPGPIPYDQIVRLDWSKWESKSLLRALLKDGPNPVEIVFDAWKFRGMAEILREIVARRPDLAPPASDRTLP